MRLIDGDALWDKAYEVWGFEADAGDTSIFMDMITNAPTIDPMKHGMWVIKEHDKDFPENFAHCSICGFPVGRWWGQDNYCPNCGARMDADE